MIKRKSENFREALMHENAHIPYENGIVNITLNSESLYEVVAPGFRFDDYADFVEACFTKKELEVVSAGQTADITFNLTISDDLEDQMLKNQFAQAREREEASLGKLYEGMYINMSAEKALGDAPVVSCNTLTEDALIEIDIPLYLRAEGRSYWIMVSNMGDCVLLPDLDAEPDNITVSTHNLSQSVLLYQDPLDSLESGQAKESRFQISHIFWGGIVLLLAAWLVISYLYKKNM